MIEKEKENHERSIVGELFVIETGTPIPAAEVTAFDVTNVRASHINDKQELSSKDLKWIQTGVSLGSSRTDVNGQFEIAFSDIGENKERDLVLIAIAPRESQKGGSARVLFVSPAIRRSIADMEEYAIGVSAELIASRSTDPGKAIRASASSAYTIKTANRTAVRDVLRENIEQKRALFEKTRIEVDKALRDRAKKRFRNGSGNIVDNYVTEVSDVRQTQKKAIKLTLSRIGRIQMEATIDPDDSARAILVDGAGNPAAGLTSNKIRDVLFDKSRHPMGSNWSFYDSLGLDCRKRTLVKNFSEESTNEGPSSENGGQTNEPAIATVDEIKKHLSALLTEIKDAGQRSENGEQSGSLAGINGFVHGLDIQGGAADQTALFDFETLNFAFDHVWEDIFDPWWSTVVANGAIEAGKFMKANARPVNGGPPPKRDLLAELEYQTASIKAATSAELGNDKSPAVMYSLIGGVIGGIKDVAGAVAGAAGEIVDIVTPGGGGSGSGGIRDHRGDGQTRDHRGTGSARDRGKRMKVLKQYLDALDDVISADYPFTVFGADDSGRAINYGQIVKYRQRWQPKSYQAGELVKTLPLAPKQKISFSTKRTTKKTYSEKRAEASENTYNSSDSSTARDIGKIVNNAKLETAYTMENKANASVPGIGGGESKTTFQTNFSIQSTRTKETFREQVRQESENFKNSTSLSIETAETEEFIEEYSGEITNPNEEIAFTCLYYELQRRYEVSERLHRLTPVVLVAESVWLPSAITPELIARYDWIIRRVLLDRSYEIGLNIIGAGSLVAEQAGLVDLEDVMDEQFAVVADLRKQLEAINRRPESRPRRRSRSLIEIGMEIVGLGSGQSVSQAGEGVLDEDEQRENELEDELRRQEGLLAQAVERFNEAFRKFAAQIILVKKLQLHIKENVIYYMQAIWDHEDNHQMLMRLRHTQVPIIRGQVVYSIAGSGANEEPPNWKRPINVVARASDFEVEDETIDLAEVADLSKPLGFFGNYRIFPLNELNPVSELLSVPFLSGRAGIHDPDWVGNYTVGDLENWAECLRSTLTEADFQVVKAKILDVMKRRLDNARPDSEEIVIPTGSLFIELLPGAHSVLENFKRQHRAIDVADALANVITKRLDHLRVAARIASDKLGDPSIEKVVIADADKVDLNDI